MPFRQQGWYSLSKQQRGTGMRKTIITLSLIGSALIILNAFEAGHALMMFLMAGIIPGTNIVINADTMVFVFASAFGFVCARLTVYAVTKMTAESSDETSRQLA